MRRDAAHLFRTRHHISHEDTIAVNDDDGADAGATSSRDVRGRRSVVSVVSAVCDVTLCVVVDIMMA